MNKKAIKTINRIRPPAGAGNFPSLKKTSRLVAAPLRQTALSLFRKKKKSPGCFSTTLPEPTKTSFPKLKTSGTTRANPHQTNPRTVNKVINKLNHCKPIQTNRYKQTVHNTVHRPYPAFATTIASRFFPKRSAKVRKHPARDRIYPIDK